MIIPEYFQDLARRKYGEAGDQWVADLPAIIHRAAQRWDLSNLTPVDDLSMNLVCQATSDQHGPVILKVQGPHNERLREVEGIRAFQGRGMCELHGWDRDDAAMLLERIEPGTNLRDTPDRDLQIQIGAGMIRTHLVEPPPEGFRRYHQWIERAFRIAREEHFAEDRPHHDLSGQAEPLMTRTLRYWQEIAHEPMVLFHGDLHHDNILLDTDREWRLIDPQAVIGPAVCATGRFFQNHVLFRRSFEADLTMDTANQMASHLEETPDRLLKVLFTLQVLSVLWDQEMFAPIDSIRAGFDECQAIADLIRD